MARFSYQAKDRQGGTVSGTVDAESPSLAAAQVREMGYFPVRIEPVRASIGESSAGRAEPIEVAAGVRALFRAVSLPALAFFWRELASILRAGIPITQGLQHLAGGTGSRGLKRALTGMIGTIETGGRLADALARYPSIFPPIQVAMMRAGEESGRIESMAQAVAEDIEREMRLRRRIGLAIAYPILLLLAALFIPHLPVLVLNGPGPFLRVALIPLGMAAFALIIFYLILRSLLMIPAISLIYDAIKLRLPLVGGITRQLNTARFCRTLAALYESGLPLRRAILTAIHACGNQLMRRRLLRQADLLERGEPISIMLAEAGMFDPAVVSMASTGEAAGDLPGMLNRMAGYLEESAHHRIGIGLSVGAVLLFLVIAAYAASIILRMYGQYIGGLQQVIPQ